MNNPDSLLQDIASYARSPVILIYPSAVVMPEAPDLHSLFVQLQTRYPTSGLLTELVQIHADHFVVRAIVQLGGMTLATSLATAATVEQAEDQARLRVLALLGIHPVSDASELSFPSYSAPAVPLTNAFKTMTQLSNSLDGVTLQDHVTPIALPDVERSIDHSPLPALAFEPAIVPDPLPFSTASVDSPAVTSYIPEMELDTFDAPPDRDEAPDEDALYDDEPFEEPEPPAIEEAGSDRTIADDVPLTAEEPASKSKPRKPGTSKESPSPATDSSETTSGGASRDLSSLISQIGVEIDRIGWSKRQGSTYLQKTYGKKTRSELTDDELEDFLTYLNTQPSAGEG